MSFTIYCCGTSSNSFDAFGDMDRPADEWDKKPKELEELWKKGQSEDVAIRTPAKAKLNEIYQARRATVTLRKNYFEGEIVSTLAKNNRGHEYADWVLIDGPGSGNYQSNMLWTKPGDYSDSHGIITGAGMDENVKHAIAVLKNEPGYRTEGVTAQTLQQQIIKMRRKGTVVPKFVNLIGWSRGAVTCIMIANAIAADKDLKGIKVRIFAVDPVPGGVNQEFYSKMDQLPKCVSEYWGIYARDEVSRCFSPVIPKRLGTTTDIRLIPLPGMHATVAGNSFIDKKAQVQSAFNLRGPGRVARYWAERCLVRWGVEMQRTANYSDFELCAMYDEMLANDAEFLRMRKYAYVGMRQGYWDAKRQVYIPGTGYLSNYWTFDSLGTYNQQLSMMIQVKTRTFVNWHHQETFKMAHRKAWNKLTRGY